MFLFSFKPFSYNNPNIVTDTTNPITDPVYSGYKLTTNPTLDYSTIDYTNANNITDITATNEFTSVFYSPKYEGFIQALAATATPGGSIDVGLVTNVTPALATKFTIKRKSATIFKISTTINNNKFNLCYTSDLGVFLNNDIDYDVESVWAVSFYIENPS